MAKHSIELTFVSGIVHGQDPIAIRIGLALAHALDASPDHELAIYWDTFLASLGEPVRKELEMELQRRGWQPRSEWGKEIFANGVAEGMVEGERLGIAKGELLGQVKGRAAAVIALLEVRGVSVSTALREQVMGCTDLTLLDRWFRRAATAHSLEETFAP